MSHDLSVKMKKHTVHKHSIQFRSEDKNAPFDRIYIKKEDVPRDADTVVVEAHFS